MASEANHDSHLQLSLEAAVTAVGDPAWNGVPQDTSSTAAPSDARPLPFFDLQSAEPLPAELLDPVPQGTEFGGRRLPASTRPSTAGALRQASPNVSGPAAAAWSPAGAGTPPGAPLPSGAPAPSGAGPGAIWLNGDVLMCACPDCAAPMTIRLWLMIADCWQCGTSIELSEQQEREARRLIEQRDQQQRPAASAASARPAAPTVVALPAERPADSAPRPEQIPVRAPQSSPVTPPATPPTPPAAPVRSPRPATASPVAPPTAVTAPAADAAARSRTRASTVRRRLRQLSAQRGVHVWVHEMFRMTPAWLVSLVFHLVLLTILGMLSITEDDGPYITLSAVVDREIHREGGQKVDLTPQDQVDFDLPVPDNVDLEQTEQREAIARADQEARELRLDPDAVEPNLPNLEQVKQQIRTASTTRQALAARDPRVRVEMVQREGGTTLTEAAVARGLRWLADQQNADGSWSLQRAGGAVRNDAAGTSLALLPFLGAGQSHLVGRYQNTVSKGLRWMVQHQRADGDIRGSHDNSGMYAQGQGAIVLCEAYLLSGDEELRVPAQKAIDFIVEAQHPQGGWRYQPGQPGDTSVFGWQLMALQSARAANLTVPPETFQLAGHYLDSVQSQDGALYAYMPRNRPTEVMTAEALLCRMYLGWNKDVPGLIDGMRFLSDSHLPSRNAPNPYYWYYGTQAFHHLGGPEWERWNLHMRDILVNSQETRGRDAGSWPVQGPHSSAGGRIYTTSLAVCTLEVYYRHLPIFRQLDLD